MRTWGFLPPLLLVSVGCAEGPVRATGQTEAFWEGSYTGLQTSDSVQDCSRCNCRTDATRRRLVVAAGKASLQYPDGSIAAGRWGNDGDLHLSSPTRQITITPVIDRGTGKRGLHGRVLAGNGPWCKFTLVLREDAA